MAHRRPGAARMIDNNTAVREAMEIEQYESEERP